MYKHIVNGFAAHEEEQIEPSVDAGWHTCANYRVKQEISNKAKRLKVKRNPNDRTKQKRANIITKFWDEGMHVSIERQRAIYCKDPDGIDMTYLQESKQAKLGSLTIVTDNKVDNNFNVILSCKRSNPKDMTFVALKVLEAKKKIKSETMMIYDSANCHAGNAE
jgi:hypothetical protein